MLNNSPQTNRRPRLGFGRRLCGFFGRWIRWQRPFPAAAGELNPQNDMQAPPFHVASEALNHIRKGSRPRPGMQATLFLAYGFEEHDKEGRLTSKFEGEHVMVGYHYFSQVVQWPQFYLGGSSISIHPDLLNRLRGTTLTLRMLNLDPDSGPHLFHEILVIA